MVTKTKAKCKICRRLGVKLFLKGERCFSTKCAMIKKPYPPGQPGKRKKSGPSEYALQLREKQKMRNYYQLREKEFKKYVEWVLNQRGKVEDASFLLLKKIESRLDNIIFKAGFALSRRHARQLVSHGFFKVNDQPINIPSFEVKKGDEISLREGAEKKKIFQDLKTILKNKKIPSWLKVDIEKMKIKVVGEPTLKEAPPVEISTIFEFYSR